MKTIKQSIIVETLTSQFTEKDISFETLDDGHVTGSSIMLYTGKIDKDQFNIASQENCDYPRLFDRDCYYQVWVDLNNGKLRVFKISGYPDKNSHSPDYLRDKPYRSRNPKKNAIDKASDWNRWERHCRERLRAYT